MRPLHLVGLLIPLVGCPTEQPPGPWEAPEGWVAGEAIACAAPFTGWRDRFTFAADTLGLTTPVATLDPNQGSVAADDIDGDGDVDLLYTTSEDAAFTVFRNDGGQFTLAQVLDATDPPFGALALADRTGDGLPEAWLANASGLFVYPNLGSSFGLPVRLMEQPFDDWFRVQTFSVGDADGDGDLDVAFLQAENVADLPEPGEPPPTTFVGTSDRLLLLDGDTLSGDIELASDQGTLVLVGLFTDRDGDGDQDLLVPSDRDLPTNLWRNDGGVFTEEAAALSVDLRVEGMGIDTADLNEDGRLDYCITDTGPPVCIVATDNGYVEEGVARGLEPALPGLANATVGWSIEMLDFDNDGWLDVLQASGPEGGSQEAYADLLWAGGPGNTFEDVTIETPFGDPRAHFGAASADFDGDGSLDWVTVGHGEPPRLFTNRCGGAWLRVRLRGLSANRQGFGARAEVRFGDRLLVQELQGLRGQGQRPSWFRFGLGDAEVADSVRIIWPDGAVSEAANVPLNRTVDVSHPGTL